MKVEQKTYLSDEYISRMEVIDHSWDGHTDWFYVCHRDSEHKVLYADEKGRLYYGLREFGRIIPVVWNDRKEAGRVARRQTGRVRKYPYRLK